MADMQKLCRITVPGLSVKRDFTAARRRLLAEFPDIQEVVATTAPETLLVLCAGCEDVAAWLDTLRPPGDTQAAQDRQAPALARWRLDGR